MDPAGPSRRSEREIVMTTKGREYKLDQLHSIFCSDRARLLIQIKSTNEFLQGTVTLEEARAHRDSVSQLLNAIRQTTDSMLELDPECDIHEKLAEVNDSAVDVINRIVMSTKSLITAPGAASNASMVSRASSVSSTRRWEAVAQAAALKIERESLQAERQRAAELERLEAEAKKKIEDLKSQIEEERLTTRIRMEEAKEQIWKEVEDAEAEGRAVLPPHTSSSAFTPQRIQTTVQQSDPYVPRYYAVRDAPADYAYSRQTSAAFHDVPTARVVSSAPSRRPTTSASDVQMDILARAIASSRVPIPEPQVFNGDPFRYPEWKASFELFVSNSGIPVEERIFHLKKYLSGTAREAVSGLFMLRGELPYTEAREILEKRYGDPFVMSNAFRSKLDSWLNITNKDKAGLRKFADYLRQCQTAAAVMPELAILDDPREIYKLACKLPEWMTHRWNRISATSRRDTGLYPSFRDFTRFVEEESEIINDALSSLELLKPNKQPSQLSKPEAKRTTLNTHSQPDLLCLFCKRNSHALEDCRNFTKLATVEKKEFIKQEKLCFGCLETGHLSRQCTSKKECKKCHKQHPTCLHEDRPAENKSSSGQPSSKRQQPLRESAPQATASQQAKDSSATERGSCGKISSRDDRRGLTSMAVPVFLSTAEDPDREILTYALLDTMSDTTFVLGALAEELQAPSKPATLRLTTLTNSSDRAACRKYTNLKVRGFRSHKTIQLPATYSRSHIPLDERHVPVPETAKQWPHLSALEEVLVPYQNCPVGLLIGYNCPQALAPLNSIVGGDGQPYAVETALGWSIVGGTARSGGSVHRTQAEETTAAEFLRVLDQDFRNSEPDIKVMSQDDKKFLKILQEGTVQREDGYYEMPLPFKKEAPQLPSNRETVLRRAQALERQFHKRPEYLDHYKAFMNEILQRGDAEKIPHEEVGNTNHWYIPHHGVYHPNKPGKVRVVFDCSARHRGVCINDHLLQGPDLVNPLVGVLCRFREGPVAFTCDVEKMFHQFRVRRDHQDYLRFLWWEDGDLSKPPADYRMKVHLFGATSSPGCANYGLQQIAKDYQHLGKAAAEFLQRNFYVDDGLKGEASAAAAIDLLEKARSICRKGNLRLHKIVSNNAEVMNSVPETERGNPDSTSLDIDQRNRVIEKTLGLQWCVEADSFCFRLNLKDSPSTRRGILSTVASIYDPLGLIAPVILVGRRILQAMCKENLGWDQAITDSLRPSWEQWREDLKRLEDFKIPRCYQPEGFGRLVDVQLHHFSDASLSGYGQCSYLRLVDSGGQVHCTLVMAKARVTPVKATTVPRLELQAAVLSANIAKILEAELSYSQVSHVYWTDSKVVLGYIKNEAARFHMFVANRVERIHQVSTPDQWHYIPTGENPADHASRGLTVGEMSSSNWFTGPKFLWQKNIEIQDPLTEVAPDDVEVKAATFLTQKSSFSCFEERLGRFSSYSKLIKAVSAIISRCAHQKGVQMSAVEASQLAEKKLIKIIQREHFDGDRSLQSKSHPLVHLDPFYDNEGVLRVGGRLRKAEELYGVKHPAILPKKSRLSHLLARHYHIKTAHQGRNLTMNELRSRGLWIIGCRSVTSSVIRDCLACSKARGANQGQKMADLPQERLEPSPPFTYCGIDCFGPFSVKEGRSEKKRYGLLFTCLAMRAIHIEVLDDLSTDSFLNGLRCFIAIRGKVRMIRCDQGTNFVGAKHELKQNLPKLNQEVIVSKMQDLECEFQFNPPSASHMGGVWERQIRSIRSVLTSTLDSSNPCLDTSGLRTLMYEAMAIVNSRPLTVENLERADCPAPLAPNHLLTMKSGQVAPPPPGTFEKEDIYLRKRWRRVQFFANQFWTRWKKEYLQNLQPRRKWHQPAPAVKIGDIVLLQDDNDRRNDWKMARVVETCPSHDGLIRRARLLMATPQLDSQGRPLHHRTFLDRPVHKLIVLIPGESSPDQASSR